VETVNEQAIREAFSGAGVGQITAGAIGQFSKYLDLLLRWNKRLNLTAIREPNRVIQRHFVECAFAALHLPEDIETLLDYGSGAGFPGIPAAICRPEIRVTLAESHGKKASFLREAVRVLDLDAQIYGGRVEGMRQGQLFDAVTMRAVEKMELAIPIALQHATKYLVLLTTERSAAGLHGRFSGLDWSEACHLPGSDQGLLEIARRPPGQFVPRGTNEIQ
jgi:16S rRNA (guanine527-N7)-methyltransferase